MSAHHHHHGPLGLALLLTAGFALIELLGGLFSHSLALLADAGHMASDVAALALALIARRIAERPAHERMTYGYGRARVLAAQANGVGLWFLCGWIGWEAFERLDSPPEVNGPVVLLVALLGLIINLLILKWLHGEHDINTRAAYWHVLGDALGSVAAMLSGAVILFTGWMLIDPLLSFLVVLILATGGWKLIRSTTRELMAGVPDSFDLEQILKAMTEIGGISDAHHIHLWLLPDGRTALSAHLCVERMERWPELLPLLLECLGELGIDHATLQPESEAAGACPDCFSPGRPQNGIPDQD